MEQIFDSIILNMDYVTLIFIRVTALTVSSPIFGRRNIPNLAKIGLCLMLTYIIFSANPPSGAVVFSNLFHFAMVAIMELLFGLIMGYVTTLFFSITQTAGYVMDMQMGFGMVNVFDMQMNISVPVTGNLYYIMMLISFFTVNGHHRLIYILQSTFAYIPAGQVSISPQLAVAAVEVFALSFVLVINVAMPMLASGLLTELVMGVVVRTTPQMNVFVVGMPLKILVGFLILIFLAPVFINYTNVLFDKMYSAIDYMLRGLVGIQ